MLGIMKRSNALALSRDTMPAFLVFLFFVALITVFSLQSNSFLSIDNMLNVLVNNVVLLAIVALGMTFVISSGGIDLSVGISVDMASMVFIMLLASGYGALVSIAGGLGAAVCVGLANAVLITRLKVNPFLATLGTLFIGQSLEKVATDGGHPIYLITGAPVAIFNAISRSSFAGVPTPVIILILSILICGVLLHKSTFGRFIKVIGMEPGVARHSGIRTRLNLSAVYIGCAFICGITGLLLASSVRSFVPLSGNVFLLDSIGAAFVGMAISRERSPSIIGTIYGVLLLAIARNGLLLVGWNFYWQQVGIGVIVFAVIAIGFGLQPKRA